MAAVSTISTINVDRPRAKSSEAPTRLNNWPTNPICALLAGTKLPICASKAISAFCRKKVDLPAMFGPVSNQIALFDKSQSLAINGSPLFISACSTTGCRPPEMSNAQLSSTTGLHQLFFSDKSASELAKSISARACAVVEMASATSKIAAVSSANMRFSISKERFPAFKILVSISESSTVVKRT